MVGWLLAAAPLVVFAQDTVPRQTWTVDGAVQLGKRAGPIPIANNWVVVHRIASDAAGNVTGGALDSARTDSRGRYRIRFPHYGQAQATYIAITTFSGVSYITSPLTRQSVSGDDAAIMVFDTTSPPYPIHVAGRHLIITSPDTGDSRRVVEVYEILNDSTFTVMGTEANPVWRAPVPAGAKDFTINPVGDISPAMTKVVGDWLHVFSPISPGMRQVSFTYSLPSESFPLVMPVVDSTTVFELLVQEPDAIVEGGGFTEVAGVAQEGIPFRRLLAQSVPARAMIRFTMPAASRRGERRVVSMVAIGLAAVMALTLVFVFWKRRRPVGAGETTIAAVPTPVEMLVRELAMLDAGFERRTDVTAPDRAEFDARRNELKARLNAALADGSRPA